MPRGLQPPALSGQRAVGHPGKYAQTRDTEKGGIRELVDLLIREWEMSRRSVLETRAADRRKAFLHVVPLRGHDFRRPVEADLRLPEVLQPVRGGVAVPLLRRTAIALGKQALLLRGRRGGEHRAHDREVAVDDI